MLFALSTLVLLSLVVGPSAARSDLAAALLWIVLLFSATAGLGHNFAREVESGTLALLQQSVPAGPVLLGKWLAAGSLIVVVVALILFASSVLFAPIVGNVGGFLAILSLGTLALAVTLPLISSLLAYARRHGGLVSVLAFPILLPGLLTSVVGTKRALEGEWPGGELRVLVAIVGVMTIAGWRLFEFVWNE